MRVNKWWQNFFILVHCAFKLLTLLVTELLIRLSNKLLTISDHSDTYIQMTEYIFKIINNHYAWELLQSRILCKQEKSNSGFSFTSF